MKRILLLAITFASFSYGVQAQIVNIPDANFKTYLVGNTAINTNLDTEIQESEANAFTGNVFCAGLGILDLTGIEFFTSIPQLDCNSNSLSSLDVTQNTALTLLTCTSNQLTSLDVTQNTALITLGCSDNPINTLDVTQNTALTTLWCAVNSLSSLDVTQNTALTSLYCFNNQLPSLDVTQNTALTILHCDQNQLTGLDVTQNLVLTDLYCDQNQIPTLDLTQNTVLTKLECGNNQLTSLDVTQNTVLSIFYCYSNLISSLDVTLNLSLTDLRCSGNPLITLDVSQNPVLTSLYCQTDQLTSLDVSNGNNINFLNFNALFNPNLPCIEVDDDVWSTANWPNIDVTASYSTNCAAACIINIPDPNFKAYLVGNAAINTNADAEIQCSEASAFIGTIDCNSLAISDLTGIEAFTSLTVLICNSNGLLALDVTANTALVELRCDGNFIPGLDVTQNTALTHLFCYGNSLPSLDVTQNTSLLELNCSSNLITALDVTQNLSLTYLVCGNNGITNLDVAVNTALVTLFCDNNSLTSLDVSTNTALTTLYCYNNGITNLDLSTNTALVTLTCEYNTLTSLDVSTNIALTNINCANNSIVSLDVSANAVLTLLTCNSNSLTTLNVANGINISFVWFNTTNNPNLSCITVDNVPWSVANWTSGVNKDATASFSANCAMTLVLPPNDLSTVNCIGDAVQPVSPVVMDQCSNTLTPVITVNPDPVCEGDKIWTFTYTDCGGGVSVYTYTYTINYATAPVVPSNDFSIISCIGDAVQPASPVVMDQCSNTLTPVITVNPDPVCEGDKIWTFTYTDCGGGVSVYTYTYTINYATAPVVPSNDFSTVSCIGDAVQPVSPMVTDQCGNMLTPVITADPDPICSGSKAYTFIYTDCAGYSSAYTYTYTVNDNINPTGSNPASVNVECAGDIPVQDVLVVTDEADNCTLVPVVTFVSEVSDGLTNPETITRTYSIQDDCGNLINVVQLIIVQDVTPPTLDTPCMPEISVVCEVTSLTTPSATDNCAGSVTITHNATLPITSSTTVTWTLVDVNGNSTTYDQVVTINAIDVTTVMVNNGIVAMNSNADSYQWVDCNNGNTPIPGETGQTFAPTANGSYAVEITVGNCTETSACENINTLGMKINEITMVTIYPNPASDQIMIDSEEMIEGISIFNMFGELVQQETSAAFSVSALSNGVYVMNIQTSNGIVRSRFVKK